MPLWVVHETAFLTGESGTAAGGVCFDGDFAGDRRRFSCLLYRESLEILDMIAEPVPRIGTQTTAEASTQ